MTVATNLTNVASVISVASVIDATKTDSATTVGETARPEKDHARVTEESK